jgi:hypothetical protein
MLPESMLRHEAPGMEMSLITPLARTVLYLSYGALSRYI